MFDWNGAKSRKKLFSSKSESPEHSKHKKRCDGNLPMTRLQIVSDFNLPDVDKNGGGPFYNTTSPSPSPSSVVVDDDIFNVAPGPGVVARLMGLDAFPNSSAVDSCFPCTPLFDSYQTTTKIRNGYCLGQDRDLAVGSGTGSKYQKVLLPIEKFQDEMLPPKSARSIPITHHKLMSPIRSGDFMRSKDDDRMMEVAKRIVVDPRSQVSGGNKTTRGSGIGSSSVPLKVGDLKERIRAAERRSQGKQELSRGSGVKRKGSNGVVVANDSDGGKSQGKSISLALLAKANVQKREGLSLNCSRSLRESNEVNPNPNPNIDPDPDHLAQKCAVKRQIVSSVLQQNNQKQNGVVDKGNSVSKSRSKEVKAKPLGKESSSSKQPSVSKLSTASKVSSRSHSCSKTEDNKGVFTSKKRSIDGVYRSGKSKPSHSPQKDKSGKANKSSSWEHGNEGTGTDIVSFTFTSPMAQSGHDSRRGADTSRPNSKVSTGSQIITSPLTSDSSKFSFPVCNVKGSDALSILLDQKLKELAHKVDLSQQRSTTVLQEEDKSIHDNQVLEGLCIRDNNTSRTQKLLDCHLPSPVSTLEHFSFGDRCSSPDSADSNSTEGSKPHSSTQTQQVLDLHSSKASSSSISTEGDAELSDSASSTSAETKADSNWEFNYIREILRDIKPMFTNYVSGRSKKIISPRLFHRVGNEKGCLNTPNQRLLFDCVTECLDAKLKRYTNGGFQSWAKGASMVRHTERLTEEVYKEISDWSVTGDCMIDDLVDQDMSGQSRKWLDYNIESFELGIWIESRVLKSLMDEIIADMLFL